MKITLETLMLDFGVDVTPAEGLHGTELQQWLERVEDEVFEREHSEFSRQAVVSNSQK